MYKMNSISKISILFCVLFTSATYSQMDISGFSATDKVIADLLMSTDLDKTKIAVKILYGQEKPKDELLDVAAYKAHQMFLTRAHTKIDTLAWSIKALGNSSRNRYFTFLTDIKSNTTNKKLVKHLNEAISKLKKTSFEVQFDVVEYKANTKLSLIKKPGSTISFSKDYLDVIVKEDRLETVYEKLGHPSSIEVLQSTKRVYVFYTMSKYKNIEISNIRFIYKGAGYVNFKSTDGAKHINVVEYVARFQAEHIGGNTSQKERVDGYSHNTLQSNVVKGDIYNGLDVRLINANSKDSRYLAKRLYKEGNYSEEYLDAVAKKLWVEKENKDPYMVDAAAFFCLYMANGKNPRYVSHMENIVNRTNSSKVRSYAKKALKKISTNIGSVEQYDPRSHVVSSKLIVEDFQELESSTAKENIYENLEENLLNSNSGESRYLAKRLYRLRKYSEEYLDAVAKKLWIERETKDPHMVDALAFFCLYIADGSSPRYSSLMTDIAKIAKSSKVRSYAKKALKKISVDSGNVVQYKPG